MKAESNLEKVLEAGKFAVTGELGPPKSADPGVVIKKVGHLKGNVDAVNLTDNQTSIVRLSSIAAARILLDHELEPVMQMVVRDRNRIALQSDILGAAALGIKNILCLSGDHQCFGNHPTAKNVFDIDSMQLIQAVKNMRDDKKFINGDEIMVEPRMYIGAAVNPFADPFDYRVKRLAKKIKAGSDFIQTQVIYDMGRFEKFMADVRREGLHEQVHILGGVTPLKSPKGAKFINKFVSGISIPQEIIDRLGKSEDPDEQKAEGLTQAIETIEHLKTIEGIDGVHVMAIAWESKVPEIAERAGLLPRPQL
jgi:methylenetetrahydrofolate reductase (NADPH)